MNHTAKLAKLQQAATKERAAARDAQADAETAQQTAAMARDGLVEAHASGSDIRKAEQALAKARDKAEAAAIRAEGAARRVERAEQEARTYESRHVDELLSELEPQAITAAEHLADSARELYHAHTEWHDVSAKVSALLRHVPGVQDVPSDHALASVARDVRNFLREANAVETPLPRRHATHRYEAPESTGVTA